MGRRLVVGAVAVPLTVALAVSAPAAVADRSTVADQLVADGVARDETVVDPAGAPSTVIMVVTPGTDDTSLHPRIDEMVGSQRTVVVNYPESFFPVISGKSGAVLPVFAPTMEQSVAAGTAANVTVMRRMAQDDDASTRVVYTGYSQGAMAVGNAVEEAVAQGIPLENSEAVLVSDPRGPWGIAQGMQRIPGGSVVVVLLGARTDGARDPKKSGNVPVTSQIVTADPIANFQWVWYRPASSVAVNLLGYNACHVTARCYGDLGQYEAPTVLYSEAGNTTYVIYTSQHPMTLTMKQMYDTLGISYSKVDEDRWEAISQAYYPISSPRPSTAAVPVSTGRAASTTARAAQESPSTDGSTIEIITGPAGTAQQAAPAEPAESPGTTQSPGPAAPAPTPGDAPDPTTVPPLADPNPGPAAVDHSSVTPPSDDASAGSNGPVMFTNSSELLQVRREPTGFSTAVPPNVGGGLVSPIAP